MIKKIKSLCLAVLSSVIAMTALSACNSDSGGNGGGGTDFQTMIVTIASMTDSGTSFTYQNGGVTSSVITLTSTQALNKKAFKEGDRAMIAFLYENGNQSATNIGSGEIKLYAISPVINGVLKTSEAGESMTSAPLESAYCWMAGPYVNIQVGCVLRKEPKKFQLVLDEKTAGEEYPSVYLLFESDDETNGVLKTVVSSFNLTEFWDNPANYKGFKLKTSVLNGQREWTFNRYGMAPVEPQQ